MTKKRYFPSKEFDSKFEQELHEGVLKNWEFHTKKVKYNIEHIYTPDFSLQVGKNLILLEAKAIFRDSSEAAKYTWIRDSLPSNCELIFLFQHPDKELWFRQKRKDGTRMSNREWAEKNGFRWFTTKTLVSAVEN